MVKRSSGCGLTADGQVLAVGRPGGGADTAARQVAGSVSLVKVSPERL
jgi:hypothetical protein